MLSVISDSLTLASFNGRRRLPVRALPAPTWEVHLPRRARRPRPVARNG